MKIYSEKIISDHREIENLDSKTISRYLQDRFRNLEDETFEMSNDDLRTITAYDHYICKRILANEHVIPGARFDTYLKEISTEMLNQPLLYFTLPIRNLDNNLLHKYIPRFHDIVVLVNQKIAEAIKIQKDFELYITGKGPKPPQSDINKLIKFYNYTSTYDTKEFLLISQETMIQYLLSRSSSLGFQSSSFIFKYFGYQKCRKNGLEDTQILFGKPLKYTILGESDGESTISITKKYSKRINFNNNGLSTEFATDKQTNNYEGIVMLKTLFHELRHQLQAKKCAECENSDISYMYGSCDIIGEIDNKDYDRNYWCYEIENDANRYGWIDTIELIKKYMSSKKTSLVHQIEYNFLMKIFAKEKISYQQDENSKYHFTSYHINSKIDEYFKKNPSVLNGKYCQFLKFYHYDGSPKDALQLLATEETAEEDDFYLGQVLTRIHKSKNVNFLNEASTKYPKEEDQKRIIKNIARVIYAIYRKLSAIKCYDGFDEAARVSKIDDKNGVFIKKNVICYFNMALIIVEYLRNYLQNNPIIIEKYSQFIEFYLNGPSGINNCLRLINENKIIKSIFKNETIDKIEINSPSARSMGGK